MVTKRFTRWLRKSQTGQSVVILALGMVGLLAVVGVTVDISLLFIRFNTLRRAVDSASIAAAGQMRQDRTMAEVGLAARQFIEFHNVDPRDVLVETCHTAQVVDLDPDTPEVEIDETLCTPDQRKLVRVTAEIESPTVFLRLLGFDSVTLRASATSETAVLDVVLVLDVSESMLNETEYEDWAQANQGYAYVPPRAWSVGNYSGDLATGTNDPESIFGRGLLDGTYDNTDWNTVFDDFYDKFWQQDLLGVTQAEVNDRLTYSQGVQPPLANDNYPVQVFLPTGTPNPTAQAQPRFECRVRFHPFSQGIPVPDYIQDLYAAEGITWTENNWGAFVPTYNFYGCCNDPGSDSNPTDAMMLATTGMDGVVVPGDLTAPDLNFSDLVCEPFKSARDATRQFLERIDFVRGDRVAFVTFDRTAFLIDPDGNRPDQNHMIEDFDTALDTLNRMVGVRAEPNFYDWDEANGGWLGFAQGVDEFGESVPINYGAYLNDPQWGNPFTYNDYPVKDNCPFHNAAMVYPFSRYATRAAPGGIDLGTLPNGDPTDGSEALWNIMTPDVVNDSMWNNTAQLNNLGPLNSYELWASCRGTNIGAAIREGNNALTDPTTNRREGTVWVMIMLSDGAAGASDPARRNGFTATPANPYVQTSELDNPTGNPQRYGQRGQYGAFGVCPFGTPGSFAELTDTQGESPIVFPFCLDEQPETRHFCYPPTARADNGGDSSVGDPSFEVGFGPGARDRNYDYSLSAEQNGALGRTYDLDVGNYPNDPALGVTCSLYYDVDDYARDWADFVGRVDDETGDNVTLPTIFTIGFGLNFNNGRVGDTPGTCDDNISDCLGEELLRYIADVGDNFRIDTNYQQDYRDDGMLNGSITPDEYGPPGICEPPSQNAGDLGGYDPALGLDGIEFLPPTESCGNYFNAPSPEELEIVFDEIASRMFTRLAG